MQETKQASEGLEREVCKICLVLHQARASLHEFINIMLTYDKIQKICSGSDTHIIRGPFDGNPQLLRTQVGCTLTLTICVYPHSSHASQASRLVCVTSSGFFRTPLFSSPTSGPQRGLLCWMEAGSPDLDTQQQVKPGTLRVNSME